MLVALPCYLTSSFRRTNISFSSLRLKLNVILSSEFIEWAFVCLDGTEIHAHKCVLVTSNSYFRTFFTRRWLLLISVIAPRWLRTKRHCRMKCSTSLLRLFSLLETILNGFVLDSLMNSVMLFVPNFGLASHASKLQQRTLNRSANLLRPFTLFESVLIEYLRLGCIHVGSAILIRILVSSPTIHSFEPWTTMALHELEQRGRRSTNSDCTLYVSWIRICHPYFCRHKQFTPTAIIRW